ncbi:MAG: hypothetical protein U0Q15_03490 [Kineosporiaceae bacterium]
MSPQPAPERPELPELPERDAAAAAPEPAEPVAFDDDPLGPGPETALCW